MTIEVRQLLIRSEVIEHESQQHARPDTVDVEQLKRDVLASAKIWLAQQLRQLQER
jgi:hypothetical protein